MIGIIILGIAGIIFQLGVVVLQLGEDSYAAAIVFVLSVLFAGLVGLFGLTGVAGLAGLTTL